MSEQSLIDDLVATLIGAVLFSIVISGVTIGYNSPAASSSAASPVVVTTTTSLTAGQTTQHLSAVISPSPSPTAPPATPTAPPTPTLEPTAIVLDPEDHYWFERPIAADGVNYVSRFYPYGSTFRGRYQVHHGVEFENPTGTPILAIGPGRVVFAGPDDSQVYGAFPNFYGRLVVIEHDRAFHRRPVFTLYGHLSRVRAEVGQSVETGQIIGEVGESGIALGPHLHMEVRLGRNAYDATRNPELWIQPFEGYGTIAGRLLDADGNPISGALIDLYDNQNAWRRETETYGEGVNRDEGWQENFIFGDVPGGHYTVQYTVGETVHAEKVTVEAGKTASVTLQLAQETSECCNQPTTPIIPAASPEN